MHTRNLKPKLGIVVPDPGGWRYIMELIPIFENQFKVSTFTANPKRSLASLINLWILSQRVDIIFFEWANHLLTQFTTSYFSRNCKSVARLHQYELYEWGTSISWEKVDHIIPVSTGMYRRFLAKFPEYKQRVSIVPISFDPARFSFFDRTFSGELGMVARITPRKRIYETIILLYELRNKGYDFRLHIAGAPKDKHEDYLDSIYWLIEQLDLDDYVKFYGYVPEIQNWYHKIDIFISNSTTEGLQASSIEACASGAYCLSHCWEGARDIYPENQICLTEQELFNKIIEYSNLGCDEMKQRKELMYNVVNKKCRKDVVADCLLRILNDILDEK